MRLAACIRSGVAVVLAVLGSVRASTVRTDGTILTVDDADGHLTELRRPDGPNLLSETGDPSLWMLMLRRPDGTETKIGPSQAAGFSAEQTAQGLNLRWQGIALPGEPDRLDVTATVRLAPSGKTAWRLEVEGRIRGVLWQVDFPRVVGLRPLGTSRLAVPHYLGRVATNPAANGYGVTLGYPQPASMQCFAFWTVPQGDGAPATAAGDETGWLPDESTAEAIYLAAEDGQGYFKRFAVRSDKEHATLDWWVEHIPSLDTWPLPLDGKLRRLTYATPYPVVLAPYVGDMQEAAVLYHDWAKDQLWCRRGKQRDWPAKTKPGSEAEALWTPLWFRRIACWLKFYHEPAKILPEFAAYQNWLNVPMASHWYRYNISKFDDNYNEMLPGDPYLLQGIQDAKALGVQPLPYINGVIWDTDTESWHRENGLAAAVKDEAGEFVPWDIHGEIFAYMCPVEQWRAKMRETVRKLVGEHGMSGVYLDCLAATGTRPCYDPSHGHPIRGGNYRAVGNRQLMYDLRADARSYAPEACFFTEEIGETFLDVMDGFLTLDYLRSHCRPGERVFPFFSLVYHPYTINFGSDAAIGQDPDAFRLQLGSTYVWGTQPLLSSPVAQSPKKGEPTSEFLRELVKHFHDCSKLYLTGGEWIPISIRTPGSPASKRPIGLLVAEHKVEYTKNRNRNRVWTGPAVLASAWRRGESLGVTMVNITDQDQNVVLSVANPLLQDAQGRLPSTVGLGSPTAPGHGQPQMAVYPKLRKLSVRESIASLAMELTIPGGGTCTYAVRARPHQPLTFVPQGEFAQADSRGEFGFDTFRELVFADGVTLITTRVGDRTSVRAVRRQADGTALPCLGKRATRTGGQAEGHGLPRGEIDCPFLVAKTPTTFTWWEGPHLQPQVHGANESFLLATMSGREATQLYGVVEKNAMAFTLKGRVSVATNIGSGAVVKPLDRAWDASVSEETGLLCASLETMNRPLSMDDIRIVLPSPLPLPRHLRIAVDRLLDYPSDDALATSSEALRKACLDASRDPKPFVADRPLMEAMERLHALLCARTAMLPLVEIEDDWLSPGFAKEIRITPAPGYPDRKPDSIEVVPVGDWAKGAVTVTEKVLEADKATNTHTFTLTLNDGLYVERMVPVLFFLTVTRDGHEFVIPEIVRLEANRPVHLIKPVGATPAVVGRESQATFTLRNWSPHAVTAKLTAETDGFTTALASPTVECPPLSDTPVTARFTAGAKARPGSHRIRLVARWADLTEATVTGYATVDLREALVPVTDDAEWSPIAEDNVATFRREGQVAIWAKAGEEIRASIRNVRVTRYVDSCVARLLDVDGKEVWKKTIPVDEQADLLWRANATGAHTLQVSPGSGSAVVEIGNRGVGDVASERAPLNLFCSPIQRVFYVPEGAREFRFTGKDGGVDETAAVRIVSPTGRVALERGPNKASPALPNSIRVQPDERGKLWQLMITPRQDISVWLAGDVCPVLSPSPARALRGRR